jgi:RNA polymerase sigma-70 factor (ECF subfamily)
MDEPEAQHVRIPAPIPQSAAAATPQVQAEHDAAFAAFYRAFTPTLVAFLRWQGVPLRHAADLAQETMIQAYRHWDTITHPEPWTRRVASRLWAHHLAETAENPVADVPEPGPLLAITGVTAWEQRHDVLRVLDLLPSRQRQILAWTLDGYTPTEIATELQISPETVRANLYKARRAIAKQLREGKRP